MLSVPNMSKAAFKQNILLALESATGNPIKHKRDSIANKAMTTILFGNDKTGNQHNVDTFFVDEECAVSTGLAKHNTQMTEFQRLDVVVRQVEESTLYSLLPEKSMLMDIIKYCKSETNYYEFIGSFCEFIKALEITNRHLANPINGVGQIDPQRIAVLTCTHLFVNGVIEHMQGILPSTALAICESIAGTFKAE